MPELRGSAAVAHDPRRGAGGGGGGVVIVRVTSAIVLRARVVSAGLAVEVGVGDQA